jgi:hypothetical protein
VEWLKGGEARGLRGQFALLAEAKKVCCSTVGYEQSDLWLSPILGV